MYRASGEDFLAVAGGASNEAQTFLSKGAQVIIRMRGLPYDCTPTQVVSILVTHKDSIQLSSACCLSSWNFSQMATVPAKYWTTVKAFYL